MRQTARFVTHWEWLILLLLLPVLMFPTGARSLVLLVVPLLWLLRWLAHGRPIPQTPFETSLLLLLSTLLLSLTAIFDITLSFPKIAGVIAGVAIFYGSVAFARRHQHGVWLLLTLIIIAGSGVAVVGLLAAEWTGPFAFLNTIPIFLFGRELHISGAVGGVINNNELAGTLDWVAPLLIACTFGFWSRLWRLNRVAHLLLLLATVLSVLTLVATQSRGGILGLALATLVMAAIHLRRYRWLLLLCGLFILLLVIGVLAFRIPGTPDPVGDTFGLQGRLEIWSRAIYALQDFPLTGLSMNGFRRVVHLLYPLFTISPQIDLAHAHNHLLQAGLDLGLGGLVAYLSLWLIAAFLLWQSWQNLQHVHRRNQSLHVLIIGLSGSLVAAWVFGIMDAITLGARPGFIWWLLLALLTSVHDHARQSAPAGRPAALRKTKRRRPVHRPKDGSPQDGGPQEGDSHPDGRDIPEFDGYSW